MSQEYDYETEWTAGRDELAAAFAGVAEGLLAGSIRLGEGEDAVTVDAPESATLEVELESDDDELSLEVEMEWDPLEEAPAADHAGDDADIAGDGDGDADPTEESDAGADVDVDPIGGSPEAIEHADATGEGDDDPTTDPADGEPPDGQPLADPQSVVPVGAADGSGSPARFEVFQDRGEQWRWRLRHRNGNLIATSGQGYSRKHNARKGLRSVVRNAPGADVRE